MMNPLTYNINYSINLNIKDKVKALTHDLLLRKKLVFAFVKKPHSIRRIEWSIPC